MKSLVKSGDFQELGASNLSESAGGPRNCALLRGKRVALGGFTVDRPIFTESPTGSTMGLGFLSRFVVTFDFPGRRIHLRKGRGYERPDLRNRSGLSLRPRGEAVVIERVSKESPGSLAGIQAGDVLLTLGGLRADEASLFKLREALGQEGPLACSVRRGPEERRLTLSLPR
jgi:S1-C subfamily serine protease